MRSSKRHHRLLFLLLVSSSSLGGCATVFRGTTQKIEIFTDPPGATAIAGDQRVSTPGVLRFPRKAERTEVRIEKPGYESRTAILERRTDGLVWLNFVAIPVGVFSGGAIGSTRGSGWLGETGEGMVIGGAIAPAGAFATDYLTGAAYRLVPAKIVVKLRPLAAYPTGGAYGRP